MGVNPTWTTIVTVRLWCDARHAVDQPARQPGNFGKDSFSVCLWILDRTLYQQRPTVAIVVWRVSLLLASHPRRNRNPWAAPENPFLDLVGLVAPAGRLLLLAAGWG